MPQGVRGSRDSYKERFGLGDRLAVRLAALLSRKVALTAAAIDCLKGSPALQHVILHPDLLERAEELDTERLASLVAAGESLPASFVVAEQEGWRTVALEEEFLAEAGEAGEAEASLPVLAERGELLHPDEITELFTRRDIAELELTIRTSADPNEKITAIRRLRLSPAGEREKLALFALALTDRAPEVRAEAAEALTTLGLDPEIADDARALAEGNEPQKRFAAERVGQRIRSAADAQMGVLLRIIAGTLRYEPSVDIRRLLIGAIEGACRSIAEDPRSMGDLVRILIGQLRDAIEPLGPAVRRVLLVLGELNAPGLHALLQEELASIADRRLRRLLVGVAGEVAATDAQRAEASEQAIAEIMASSDPAVECLQLTNLLSKLGRHAVAAVAPRLLEASEAAQVAFVRLLDVIATRRDTSKATRVAIGRLLLSALHQGERAARLAVIQSTATVSRDIPARTRSALAAELLGCLQEYANPGILDAIEADVVKLGAPAVGPVLETLERGERPRVRVAAARVLGALVPRLEPSRSRLAHRAIEKVLALLDSSFPDRAALVRALGRACSRPVTPADDVTRVAATLRERILDKPLAHAALDGLAHLCLSPRATPALKVDLMDFFARLLERDLPDIEPTRQPDRDEIVYALGSEVLAYTEMVPSILRGLGNIAIASRGVLRDRAIERLLRVWRQVADHELQLGPGNTEQLLTILQSIGTLEEIEPRHREAIADAIARRRDFLPTCRVRAELLVSGGEAMAERAAALAEELLRRETSDELISEGDRTLILDALTRLATDAHLGPRADRLRARIVGLIVDAAKRGLEAASPLVEQLRGSPATSALVARRLPQPRS